MAGERLYILDTNVLIHDPQALYAFAGTRVGIPIEVIEDLDRFKGESSDRGKNARDVIRRLDELRHMGSLKDGVMLENKSIISILFYPEGYQALPHMSEDSSDNRILALAYALKKEGYEIHFISKDINARIKADVLGIITEDYLKGKIHVDEFYKGWLELAVPAVQLKKDQPEELLQLLEERDIQVNEYILLKSQHNEFNYRVYRYLGGKKFKPVLQQQLRWPITPRNPQQLMAFDALFDPSIQLVALLGPAGTGKTFLGLAAGLYQVLVTDDYEKMLVARPVVPLGPDIGYLPGDIQEKLQSWMQPIYDNMDFLFHTTAQQAHLAQLSRERHDEEGQDRHHRGKNKHRRKPESVGGLRTLDQLIKDNKISLEAITYMRGRSIPFQIILIDEVQNLSPHEVKTIITRVGKGSKIILAGDPYQIDSPYLDFSSNGLVVASNRFKGSELFATVFLETSERSELSRMASELL